MAPNTIRWARLLSPGGALLMTPLDHGISMGPIAGIAPVGPTLDAIAGHASCVTVHKGMVRHVAPYADRLGILMHLSGSTDHAPDPDAKRLVATVDEAAAMGCDGVSIHLNMGSRTEDQQIADAGAVATACQRLGMPLITMCYPRGPAIRDPTDPDAVASAARLAAELGADAVKVPYTGESQSFRRVVEGAGIPVIVAGGPHRDADILMHDLQGAKAAGAAGVSIGRNVFQSQDPGAAAAAIAAVWA